MTAPDPTGVLAGEPYGFHPGEVEEGQPHTLVQRTPLANLPARPFQVGVRVRAVLLDGAEVPELTGDIIPKAEWPAEMPGRWTEENAIVVRWDRGSHGVYNPETAHLSLRILEREAPAPTDPSGGAVTAPTPAPSDDAPEHGPLAATLSERTLDKVLSRPAHVPSLVMLDRAEAADRLADAVDGLLNEARNWHDINSRNKTRAALSAYREVSR